MTYDQCPIFLCGVQKCNMFPLCIVTRLSAETVSHALSGSRESYIKWRVLRILSPATPFSISDLVLLVVDLGNTRLRAGHGEAAILNTHFSF